MTHASINSVLQSRIFQYGLINAVAAAATFLCVPVLVRLLGIEGFGFWSLIEPVIFLGVTIALLGSEHGTMKDIAFEDEDVRVVLGELVPLSTLSAIIVGLLLFSASLSMISLDVALLMSGVVVTEALLMLFMTAARAARQTAAFAIGQIGRSLGFLILLVAVLLGSDSMALNVADILEIRLVLIGLLILLLLALMRPRVRFSATRYSSAVRYGSFILMMSVLTYGLDAADRYVVNFFFGEAGVGQYALHVKLASLVGQGIVMPFSLWFASERLRHIRDADGGNAFFNMTAKILTAACVATGVGGFLAGPLLFELMAPGISFSPIVLAALLCSLWFIGLSYALNIGLLTPGKTHLNLVPIACGVVIALVTEFFLGRYFGAEGVALGRLLGTLAFLFLLVRASQREHHVDFEFRQLVLIALALILPGAVIALIIDGDTWAGACLRLALYGSVLGISGVVTWSRQKDVRAKRGLSV